MEQKIKNIIKGRQFKELVGFSLLHEAEIGQIRNEQEFVDWLINSTSKKTKHDFLEDFYEVDHPCGETGLRVCDHCGKFMTEGFLLGGEYACSRECAIKLYDLSGDEAEEQLDKDLTENDEACFWTEWEQEL